MMNRRCRIAMVGLAVVPALFAGVACDNMIAAVPKVVVSCADAEDCFRLGDSAEGGRAGSGSSAVDKDVRAAAYFDRACEFGHSEACLRGSLIHWMGSSPVVQDLSRAFRMMESSCELENSEACGRLGDMYDNGWGTARSAARALELYELACEGGYGMACGDANRLRR